MISLPSVSCIFLYFDIIHNNFFIFYVFYLPLFCTILPFLFQHSDLYPYRHTLTTFKPKDSGDTQTPSISKERHSFLFLSFISVSPPFYT